uniref:Uncharacterized protein n=1 Tax=Arundo donax TaxID=35708 RepID=A0A0A9E3K4_ARUDO
MLYSMFSYVYGDILTNKAYIPISSFSPHSTCRCTEFSNLITESLCPVLIVEDEKQNINRS